ncbi:MerR family DNA-binding protein [Streptomyces iakyrus]|uniref:MerR family DNA-binding protein n=1 Tax=Streptomyces iakyrus TaxID=68219 RepID=UPI00068D8095|nr:MerR family DNA-binding protein [Streptomyces iakyrus]
MAGTMTVGQAAQAAGVTRRAVRLYEERGLLASAPRTAAGYRLYDQDDIDTLVFIRQARALDLPLDDIAAILALRRGGTAPCTAVRELVDARIAEIDRTIADLRALRASLVATRRDAAEASPASQPGGAVCPIIERQATAAG